MIIKMAADRGAYIDQSQSLNIHIAEPNYGKLTSMHFYGWKQVCPLRSSIFSYKIRESVITLPLNNVVLVIYHSFFYLKNKKNLLFSIQGLKTGMYYLRTKPAANPIQFTLNKESLKATEKQEETKERNMAAMVCSLENRDECMMCGS